MSFKVYDYREDITNLLVTPQIRARFERIEVGQSSGAMGGRGHTHDLGHEIFLVMQGRIEFRIGDQCQVLEPGQFCVALADEPHVTRNVGDEPAVLYLSVTPHIQPTHTQWLDDETKATPRFRPATQYDLPADRTTPTDALLNRHLAETRALGEAVEEAVAAQEAQADALRVALAEGDEEAMAAAREAMWEALGPMFARMYALADAWNDLTYRTEDRESWRKA